MTRIQIFLCLAIGNLAGALIWNPPSQAWDLASGFADMVNGIHDTLAPARTEAQTPLAVPQMQAPIGNSASIQPCAAPPPAMAQAPEEMPPSAMQTFRQDANPPALKPVPSAVNAPLPVASAVNAPQTAPTEIVEGRIEYNQGGSITQAQADRMRRFKKNQSYTAIRSLLGTPNFRDPDSDIYVIEGTGQGMAARKLIVSYALDAEDNFTIPRAMGWRIQ